MLVVCTLIDIVACCYSLRSYQTIPYLASYGQPSALCSFFWYFRSFLLWYVGNINRACQESHLNPSSCSIAQMVRRYVSARFERRVDISLRFFFSVFNFGVTLTPWTLAQYVFTHLGTNHRARKPFTHLSYKFIPMARVALEFSPKALSQRLCATCYIAGAQEWRDSKYFLYGCYAKHW